MAQTLTLPMILPVGTKLYGYCNGYFGRNSHYDKRVEAVGADWVVVRSGDFSDSPEFACIPEHESPAMLEKWKTKEDT